MTEEHQDAQPPIFETNAVFNSAIDRYVEIAFPAELPITWEELKLIETYLRDVIRDIANGSDLSQR